MANSFLQTDFPSLLVSYNPCTLQPAPQLRAPGSPLPCLSGQTPRDLRAHPFQLPYHTNTSGTPPVSYKRHGHAYQNTAWCPCRQNRKRPCSRCARPAQTGPTATPASGSTACACGKTKAVGFTTGGRGGARAALVLPQSCQVIHGQIQPFNRLHPHSEISSNWLFVQTAFVDLQV